MTTVRILHAGGVGAFNKDDIVKNASAGLVEIAEKEIRNAADGELLAEVVEESNDKDALKALKARAKELKIEGYGKMDAEQLENAIADAKAELERLAAEEAAKNAENQGGE